MIIWINGAFGVGKTQAAYELRRRLKGSYVYDPEQAGCFIRDNLPPSVSRADFQDYELWRKFNRDMLEFIADSFEGDIIVPMTVTNRAYYDEITSGLAERHDLRQIILCASRETILKRLGTRLEGRHSWAAEQTERCLSAFEGELPGEKIITDGLNIAQTVDIIGKLIEKELSDDKRGAIRRWMDRLAVKIGHIR